MEGVYLKPKKVKLEQYLEKYGRKVEVIRPVLPDWTYYICYFQDGPKTYARICYNIGELNKAIDSTAGTFIIYEMYIKHVRAACNEKELNKALGFTK